MSDKERFYWSLGALLAVMALLFLANLYLDAAATKHYCLNTPIDQINWEKCR